MRGADVTSERAQRRKLVTHEEDTSCEADDDADAFSVTLDDAGSDTDADCIGGDGEKDEDGAALLEAGAVL